MRKVGRNEPCHCGSGKKYKNCHQQAELEAAGKNKNIIMAGLALLIIILAAGILYFNTQSSGNTAPPPGEAPAGKVWSSEHGHWHDIE